MFENVNGIPRITCARFACGCGGKGHRLRLRRVACHARGRERESHDYSRRHAARGCKPESSCAGATRNTKSILCDCGIRARSPTPREISRASRNISRRTTQSLDAMRQPDGDAGLHADGRSVAAPIATPSFDESRSHGHPLGPSPTPTPVRLRPRRRPRLGPFWGIRGGEGVAKKPDVLLMIFNDHVTSFFFDHYSHFALGIGESYAPADEGGGPRALPPVRGHAALSHHIAGRPRRRRVRPRLLPGQAARPRLLLATVDAVAARAWLARRDRAAAGRRARIPDSLGATLLPARTEPAQGDRELPEDLKVVLVATGGLSHQVHGERCGFNNTEWDCAFSS